MKKKFWILLSIGLLTHTGCGGKPETANNTATQTPATSGNTVSPGRLTASKIQYPTDPKEVVRLFFDSMRQGNGDQLSALLSTAAREEIQRKDLKIDPLGSPNATFQIGESAPQGTDGMLIESVWSEPEQNGQPATDLDVVWELRKETAGWRIFAMAVDPQTGEEVQVVNFEHLEPDAPPPEQRMASLPGALPPTGNATPASFTQGNLPPANNTGIAPGNLPPANNPGFNSLPPATQNGFPQNPPQTGLPNIVPGPGQGTAGQQPGTLPPANYQPGNDQFRR